MKTKLCFLLILTLFIVKANAQCTVNVNIPDSNFKAELVNNSSINTNNDSEISCQEAALYSGEIDVRSKSITDLTGIEAFFNLEALDCTFNDITAIDLSANGALTDLILFGTQLSSVDLTNNTALTFLNIGGIDELTSLDVSANTALITLALVNNVNIESLDISNNILLEGLFTANTGLTRLDVSNNAALQIIDIKDGEFTNFDVSNNPNLTRLNCSGNDLVALKLSNGNNVNLDFFNSNFTNNPNLTCIEVDDLAYANANWSGLKDASASYSENCDLGCSINIPDSNFKAELVNNSSINTNNDSEISCQEAALYSGEIDVRSKSIADLTGIESFLNLQVLDCGVNNLTTLNLSANTALTNLAAGFNDLTAIDLSANTALTNLSLVDNQLSSLDLTNNTALTFLNLSNIDELTSLDVSANTALISLELSNNLNIESLDVSNNTALQVVDINNGSFTSFDVSSNPNLTRLNCSGNDLVALKLSNGNNVNLDSSTSNFTNNPNLTCIEVDDLVFANANWSSLKDASASYSENCDIDCIINIPDSNFKTELVNNSSINTNNDSEISCQEAALYSGEINVRNKSIADLTGIESFLNVRVLDCSRNNLTSLDISANTFLEELDCGFNDITSLDVISNPNLTRLDCGSNDLTTLNLSANTVLTILEAGFNDLTVIDLSANTALTNLILADNPLSSIDLTNNTALTFLNLGLLEGLTSLDISNNTLLETLFASNMSLTSLDVSSNPNLTRLNCSGNDLVALKLTNGNNINLNSSTSNFTNNPNLACIEVDNVAYANANWSAIKDATASYSENCATASIDDFFSKTVSIYPNPTAQHINFSSSKSVIKHITITDINGRQVTSIDTANKLNVSMDVSSFQKGVYIATIRTENGISNKRFIKN